MRIPIKNFQTCKISKTYLLFILSQKYSGNEARKKMIVETSIRVSEREKTKREPPQEFDGERSKDDNSVIKRNQFSLAQNRNLQENFENSETDRVSDMIDVLRWDLYF